MKKVHFSDKVETFGESFYSMHYLKSNDKHDQRSLIQKRADNYRFHKKVLEYYDKILRRVLNNKIKEIHILNTNHA